jgi:putative membrane protein
MMMHGFGIPEFLIMFVLLMLVAIGIAAFAVVFFLRRRQAAPAASPLINATTGEGSTSEDSALTILRERFARGEISKNEFDEMRQALAS